MVECIREKAEKAESFVCNLAEVAESLLLMGGEI